MQEVVEDTGLALKFYPLGKMIEWAGLIVLDEYGRFYLADGYLTFWGNTFEEFCDSTIFKERIALHIEDNGETRYGYDNSVTEFRFDAKQGWLGNSKNLYKDIFFGEGWQTRTDDEWTAWKKARQS